MLRIAKQLQPDLESLGTLRRGRRNQVAAATAILLRRDAIGERIGVKISVVTQLRPWAVLLGCVCDAGFLTFGIIVP